MILNTGREVWATSLKNKKGKTMAKIRKVKIKSEIQVKKDWVASDQYYMLVAGVENLISNTVNYFDKDDTAFYEEYMKTIKWFMKCLDGFYEKLLDKKEIKKHLFVLAEKKFYLMLEKSSQFEKNKLNFNLKSKREYDDNIYYTLLARCINIFEALLNTMGVTKENEWIHKYFKMIRIQLRSMCIIFESEMGYKNDFANK